MCNNKKKCYNALFYYLKPVEFCKCLYIIVNLAMTFSNRIFFFQMREKLAADEKIQELVRELGALEKTFNKMRAENYMVGSLLK